MSEAAAPADRGFAQRMKGKVAGIFRAPAVRQLASGVAWNMGAVGLERLIALLQSVYVAHLLGIELFGKYGLVFVTVGLLSSLIGLQLGMTASVHVARAAKTDPQWAAAVMRLCELLSAGLALAAFLAVLAVPEAAARSLLGDVRHVDIIIAAAAIACLSVVAGVQEGILQGLEQFRLLAVLRAGLAIVGFALLWLFALEGDLASVIAMLMMGVVLRTLAIAVAKQVVARGRGLVAPWAAVWQARGIVAGFSLPAVLASLVSGASNWYGIYLVSQSAGAFRDVAVLTVGQQWRGLALYLTMISAGVAIPMMSRLGGTGDDRALRDLHHANLWGNMIAAGVFVAGLSISSSIVLSLYGTGFAEGRLAFLLLVATAIPHIYANVFLQYLVSQGRLWEQLGYYVAHAIPLTFGYFMLVPSRGAEAFATWTMVVGVALCVALTLLVRVGRPISNETENFR